MTHNPDTLETLLQKLRDVRLPEAARIRMRAELSAYAQLHEIPVHAPRRSPFSIFHFRMYTGLAAILLVVVTLGSTAYASEKALPGDPLYPVKVGITEPLQTVLIPNDQGRATWHAILAERRLDETAQLAARGTLSTTTQMQLAANFDTHVSASEESANKLQNAGDATGSLSVRSDLEARLSAHAHILSVIDAHYAEADSEDAGGVHNRLQAMLAVVAERQQGITSARLALEDAIAPDSEADVASTTTRVAIATRPETSLLMSTKATSVMQVETAAALRMSEEQNILDRHAQFLAKFLPVGTTTATTTATTTDEVSPEDVEHKKLDRAIREGIRPRSVGDE